MASNETPSEGINPIKLIFSDRDRPDNNPLVISFPEKSLMDLPLQERTDYVSALTRVTKVMIGQRGREDLTEADLETVLSLDGISMSHRTDAGTHRLTSLGNGFGVEEIEQ